MSKAIFEDDLQNKIAQLPRTIQPKKDLWAGIDIALSQSATEYPKRTANVASRNWSVAAAMTTVALIGWLNFKPIFYGLDPQQVVAALSEQHNVQRQALLAEFQGQDALTENWQEQLSELDDAAGAIKIALENDPNNIALLKMLQQVYQQQIELIEKVHAPKWREI